ncbi:PREDICTED: transcription factor MYB1R1 isoform X2 [Nelumbo nucifera]|uniref:Transcription factor MYB1R1 isoform X2 n=2 Tax=Nelumbo nucifera TaxID=4432 RepID=A0A1U8AHM3_NELNU|nr:PREDICTED: transcription factor MYB1R1 isoform X2 [Nelumbo nucifera]DAD48869.1 TPA_asm: hypothetical protein HUJ06_018806 [Nelumbo nucifera]
MTRRCSHCSNNGHNSRTCPTRGGVKLFGVRLTDGSIKKSASMGNLSSSYFYSSSSAAASPNSASPSSDPLRDQTPVAEGYVSDDPAHASCSSNCRGERKKGVPWTEEEHRLFLMGLQKLGKGDWRGIARNFVISRTPTQVASHAQKYFIRQSNATRRKRRSSLFDMVPDMESELMEAIPDETVKADESVKVENFAAMVPGHFTTYLPIPFPFWPSGLAPAGEEINVGETSHHHQVLKPTPILSKDPFNVDEVVGLSTLSLGEAAAGRIEPSPLTLKLRGAPSRQSAFHANPPVSGSDLSKSNSSIIHAV